MYVIAFANPKGGSGKTTSAILLAEQIALSGGRVTILDLDPNANILLWAQSREEQGRVIPFTVQARPPVEDTVELIDKLSGAVDYLIVDLEGSKDQIVTFVLSRTDLCVIPLDGSPYGGAASGGGGTLGQDDGTKMIRAQIAYTLLFTRTNAAFLSADERDVRQEMEINNIPTLPVRIAKRAPYTRIFRDGVLLAELPEIVAEETKDKTASVSERAIKQVRSAIENARDYAQTVVKALPKERTA